MTKRGNGEGSIYRRKEDNIWVASVTLDSGKRRVFYGKTRKEAYDKLQKALSEHQQGLLIGTSKQTVEQYLVQWLAGRKHIIRSSSTRMYESFIRIHIVPVIGNVMLQKLTAQHIKMLHSKKLDEGLSPTTVVSIHRMLKTALSDAVKAGMLAKNVCNNVETPRKKEYEMKPLTLEQAQKLMKFVSGHELEAIIVLALTTGMRRGELVALKWQDINFIQGTLQVRRTITRDKKLKYIEAELKTKKSRRSVTLASLTIDILLRHRIHQGEVKLKAGSEWQEHDFVFTTAIGTSLNPESLLGRFKKILKRAELPNIRFHDLRHSAATLLLGMGVHTKIVQELLGHSTMAMTADIYSHVLPTMQQGAIDRLNDVLKTQEEKQSEDDDEGLAGAGVPRKPKK